MLEALVHHQYPPQVVALQFEAFSDGFTYEFPVRAFFVDSDNCEFFLYVDGEATYPSPVDPGLLEIDCVYPYALEEKLESESPDSDAWRLATEELFNWFLSCWQKAGGRKFPLSATISRHDFRSALDLMTGKMVR
ncbi:hypothetical protein [Luteibacter sp.]|uniref:hypothetical protein n=1 Tax=Luteibacter sp. TaxID=1886636 RepID=UPI003F81E640